MISEGDGWHWSSRTACISLQCVLCNLQLITSLSAPQSSFFLSSSSSRCGHDSLHHQRLSSTHIQDALCTDPLQLNVCVWRGRCVRRIHVRAFPGWFSVYERKLRTAGLNPSFGVRALPHLFVYRNLVCSLINEARDFPLVPVINK